MTDRKEIAQALVNLTTKEVNELSQVVNHNYNIEIPQLNIDDYKVYESDIKKIKSPREYGESIRRHKNKKIK